jgi:dihydrofolate reductase
MRKVIAAINMTIDGFCDHTYGIVNDELHSHYNAVLRSGGVMLFGRITYGMMESHWPNVVVHPTGNAATDEFARLLDAMPKLVFSHTLTEVHWNQSRLAQNDLTTEVLALKALPGKDILVGSPSLILTLANLRLIDEFQLCIHPVIAGKGLPLFKDFAEMAILKCVGMKAFGTGAVVMYYQPIAE